jgi:integrase
MPTKLTQTVAAALMPRERTFIAYDDTLAGFGVRVTPNGARSWIVDYRPGGGRRASTRRITIGPVATLPADKARRAAQQHLARARLGADPAAERAEQRAAATLREVAEKFQRLEGPTWKPRTRFLFAFYCRKHLEPAFGSKRARDITHADVVRLHRKIGEQAPPTANRIVSLLRLLFNWAGRARDVPPGHNPARGVKRFKEQGKERYLTTQELGRLGEALREAETIGLPWTVDETRPTAKHAPKPHNRREIISPFATGAIRLLLFTGCRRGEILSLRWEEVDLERGTLLLSDPKAGRRYVLLSAPAQAVLADLLRIRIGAYVIAGDDPDRPRHDLNRPWRAIARRAGLEGVRLHDLRHSFASFGAASHLGLPVIGKLLGHRQAQTTLRYAHLADDPLRRASQTVAGTIAEAMNEPAGSAEIVPLASKRRHGGKAVA